MMIIFIVLNDNNHDKKELNIGNHNKNDSDNNDNDNDTQLNMYNKQKKTYPTYFRGVMLIILVMYDMI